MVQWDVLCLPNYFKIQASKSIKYVQEMESDCVTASNEKLKIYDKVYMKKSSHYKYSFNFDGKNSFHLVNSCKLSSFLAGL